MLAAQDVVVKPNDSVTITFAKGSKLNDTTGKTEYDFTTTVTTEFANAKLPAFITQNSFITKVSYAYSGVLPASASIQIFVGKDYAGKEVFYFLLNDANTYNSNEVQKVTVNENGYITVTQDHCSDYVVTVDNPADLYEAYEESQKPEADDTTNPGSQENTNNGSENESPKTGDYAQLGLFSAFMAFAGAVMVFALKKVKRV